MPDDPRTSPLLHSTGSQSDPPMRNLTGYGSAPPHPHWPGDARLAISFVLNVEEGAERTPLNGDDIGESYLHEIPVTPARKGQRHLSAESMVDYGSRAGFWRLLRLFNERKMPLTAFACGRALELNPDAGAALAQSGHEVAGHGYRWIDYRELPASVEREHILKTIQIIKKTTGKRPVGWYTGRASLHSHRLIAEEGGFLYSSDAYDDDLPHWVPMGDRRLLIIPYALDTNDMKFCVSPGLTSGQAFCDYLSDAMDLLLEEGKHCPKMMSVGLHARISGRPGRAAALTRFLDRVTARNDIWICRREEIARHWLQVSALMGHRPH